MVRKFICFFVAVDDYKFDGDFSATVRLVVFPACLRTVWGSSSLETAPLSVLVTVTVSLLNQSKLVLTLVLT